MQSLLAPTRLCPSKSFLAAGGGARLTGTGLRLWSACALGLRCAGLLSSSLWNSHPGKRVGPKNGCALGYGGRNPANLARLISQGSTSVRVVWFPCWVSGC